MIKLLFGGTAESTEILEFLSQQNIPVTTSVVSDYGRHLASKFGQDVVQGRQLTKWLLSSKRMTLMKLLMLPIPLRILSLKKR